MILIIIIRVVAVNGAEVSVVSLPPSGGEEGGVNLIGLRYKGALAPPSRSEPQGRSGSRWIGGSHWIRQRVKRRTLVVLRTRATRGRRSRTDSRSHASSFI